MVEAGPKSDTILIIHSRPPVHLPAEENQQRVGDVGTSGTQQQLLKEGSSRMYVTQRVSPPSIAQEKQART